MIGFIGTSVTVSLLITVNIALTLIYTIYSSHALGFYVFTSRLLATDLNTELELQITMKSSCYLIFDHSVHLCPNLYSINLHNSLITLILILVPSTAEPPLGSFQWRLRVLDSRLLSYDWLQTTFTVPYKPSARNPEKTPIIEDVFTVLLLSTGHGADHIENKPRDSNLASTLARWLLPSNEL
jgi:hypothetical protein